MTRKNLTGRVFGKLTILCAAPSIGNCARWFAFCECGKGTVTRASNLLAGRVNSCGCLKRAVVHGHAKRRNKTPEYFIWVEMRQRCRNPNHEMWRFYGGRGISVSPRWNSFQRFIEDIGPRPTSRHTIDRYPDNDGNYEPGNVRWATSKQQASNTRRNIRVDVRGENMTLMQAVERYGGIYGTVLARIRRGLTPEKALGL